jgi:hypothetical protein
MRGAWALVGVLAAVACSKVGDQCADGCGGAAGGGVGGGLSIGGDGSGRGGGGLVSGAGGSITSCGGITRPIGPVPVEVLIVLDRSASMDNGVDDVMCDGGCGAASKWALATPAIEKFVAASETTINWGLKLFADPGGDTCGVNGQAVVTPEPRNTTAISAAIAAQTKANRGVIDGSRSPTRAAVTAAAGYLAAQTDPNPKMILLATDGLPTCAAATVQGDDDSPATIAAVQAAADAGIPTFVLGVATAGGDADATLNQMAQAGGLARAGSRSYYAASTPTELAAALQAVISVADEKAGQSCLFALPPAPTNDGTTSIDFIEVHGDGVQWPRDADHLEGWDYAGPLRQAIAFYGVACDAIRNGTFAEVSISFRCVEV